MSKPHIYCMSDALGRYWQCVGAGTVAVGRTPSAAYRNWAKMRAWARAWARGRGQS